MDRQFMIKAIEREQERKTLLKYDNKSMLSEKEPSFISYIITYCFLTGIVIVVAAIIG